MESVSSLSNLKSNYLVSVACDIRFPTLLITRNKIPEYQAKIRNEFPNLEIDLSGLAGILPNPPAELNEWIFTSKDNNKKIKVNVNRLVYILSKYPGYNAFKADINKYLLEFFKLCKIDRYTRVGIRYTNDIPLEKNDLIEELLELFNPVISVDVIENHPPYQFQSEYRWSSDKYKITLWNLLIKDNLGQYTYRIDIDAYTEIEGEISKVNSIIDNLHKELLSVFKENIKKKFIERTKG
ncbi:MAG: TIGR04255 family protein [Candidatus Heimdallarchaeum endolithica]|uniref:TIGR04255 family protein n=1 Tax=Candidatus Heimdallarchaeum endolithica TaxID=2876572 RepID=A0A9Y1BSL8_9ARCH|nr:MAG: TIGR04255 family protein [Candidatus Heimdallarchaeum endolithica]